MDILEFISPAIFEMTGVFVGLSGCMMILIQIIKEYRSSGKSSLSMVFLIGFILIYLFWAFYGLRFHTIALVITNSIAALLQCTLLIVVLRKNKA